MSVALAPVGLVETRQAAADRPQPAYSSKIIKAGALLGDTRTLFALWDLDQPVAANLVRFRRQNLLGKTSRKRADDVLAIFRQRYLDDASTARGAGNSDPGRATGRSA